MARALLLVARMACALFEEGTSCRCHAVVGTVVPSLHERERFCRSSEEDRCPTRIAYKSTGPLAEDDYYAIWIGPSARSTPERVVPDAQSLLVVAAGV